MARFGARPGPPVVVKLLRFDSEFMEKPQKAVNLHPALPGGYVSSQEC
jgi:hypothetical protein